MTQREQLLNLFSGNPTDRMAWTTLVDDNTLNALPDDMRGITGHDFYRYLGCSIFSLAGWGTPWGFNSPQLVMPGVETIKSLDQQGNHITQTICNEGVLIERISPQWHPLEYPVKDANDVRLLIHRWENAYFQEADDTHAYSKLTVDIGEDGLATQFLGPSTIPWLLENIIGVENFYYLMADEPDMMHALITLMQEKELTRFKIAAKHPCQIATLAENTSTAYISPYIYERYNMPSQYAFVDAMHKEGKTAILHMCGHVNNLLSVIKETKTDGIHALTPPPLGDCPWEKALDIIGEDLIIIGCLPPHYWVLPDPQDVGHALDNIITPRLRSSRFLLAPFADGIAIPLKQFQAVAEWVDSQTQ